VGINDPQCASVGWLSPIVTLALGSAIWPVIGFLDERPVMATDPAEVDRAFTVPSPSCSPKGLSSKSGGDVNWLDRAPTLTATSDLLLPSARRPHLGCNRARSHRVALRRHRRRLARGEEGWP